MALKGLSLRIQGMTCQGCAEGIKLALKRQKGVQEANIDWKPGTGVVVFDPKVTDEETILGTRIFQRGQYRADPAEG